jgi:hypothetical protein
MNLIHLSPDRDRAERTRALCHARLAAHRKKKRRADGSLEPILIGGFCAIYLASVALNAFSIFITQ